MDQLGHACVLQGLGCRGSCVVDSRVEGGHAGLFWITFGEREIERERERGEI